MSVRRKYALNTPIHMRNVVYYIPYIFVDTYNIHKASSYSVLALTAGASTISLYQITVWSNNIINVLHLLQLHYILYNYIILLKDITNYILYNMFVASNYYI